MNHYNNLLNLIQNKIHLSNDEVDTLTTSFLFIKKNKKDYLIKSGGSSQNLYFILNGYIRFFNIDNKGNEITTKLVPANNFVTSFESFLNNSDSKDNIQCISDCELLYIPKEKYTNLYHTLLNWHIFCQSIYEKYILAIDNRAYLLQHLSALDRYKKVLETDTDLVLNTPVKYLASYLGIQPQSLSRIRKKIKYIK